MDQTIAAGDRFDMELDYHSAAGDGWRLGFTAVYDGSRWRSEGDVEPPRT